MTLPHSATPAHPAGERFARAIAGIDAANAADPNRVLVRGQTRPKELAHAELLTERIRELRPQPSEALLLAARAHHIQRWEVPRSSYPPGREAYLRWRVDLHRFHADRAAAILRDCGYDEATIARVQAIVQKRRRTSDPEVQALEDGLCLVFLETQLDTVGDRIADEKMVEVLRKTWGKMTPAGREAALRLPLSAHGRGLVERALAGD